MTKRAAVVAVVAVLALAACGSSGKSSSAKAKKPPASTTTIAPKKVAAVTTIASRLGCAKPKPTASSFPVRTTTVVCAPSGIEYHVNVYDRASDMNVLTSAAGVKLNCALAKAMHVTGPLYSLKGSDYSVQALKVAKNNTRAPITLAQAKALSSVLGASVVTTPCPA